MFQIYYRLDDLLRTQQGAAMLVLSKGDLNPIWTDVDYICNKHGCIAVYGTKEHCDHLRAAHPDIYRYHLAKAACNWLSHGKYDKSCTLRPYNEVSKHIFNKYEADYEKPNTQHSLESYLIGVYTNPGSTVFDPYGDFDIFRTVMDMGRKYIGVQENAKLRKKMVGYVDI